MTEEQAQRIVYSFIDTVSQGASIVCDEDRLSYSKEEIKNAFYIHILGYENMRALSEEHFNKMGYGKDLSDLQAMLVRVDDFKKIAPEDKLAIAELMSKKMPSDKSMEVMFKYLAP